MYQCPFNFLSDRGFLSVLTQINCNDSFRVKIKAWYNITYNQQRKFKLQAIRDEGCCFWSEKKKGCTFHECASKWASNDVTKKIPWSSKHVLLLVHSRFQCVFIASLKFAFMSSYVLPRLLFSSIEAAKSSCKPLRCVEDKSSGGKLNGW